MSEEEKEIESAFDDIFGGLLDEVRATEPKQPRRPPQPIPPRPNGSEDLARIANAVELTAALQAHAFFECQRDSVHITGDSKQCIALGKQKDAAKRAMDKIAPIIQLRTGRLVRGF